MAFIRSKVIKGHTYYYLVESIRKGKTVRQVILQYFGTTLPGGYVVPAKASVVLTTEAPSQVSTTLVSVAFPHAEGEVVSRRAADKGLSMGDYLRWLSTRSHHKQKGDSNPRGLF
ncbi:unnamed protein product [marine sediment metagenome]|uniref:Uncharacterized protein n=1 Tax=marine sediment metagenome TaxID=412755 RepID=X1NZE1_9ZZZZ